VPHYSYVDEGDVTELVRLREAFKEPYAQRGVKLTYLAFFVKAAAAALKEVPLVNSSLDEAANEIVLHDQYHIGIAVATPGGLIVPVVRDVDRQDMAAIARDIERLSADARAGKTKLEDLRGGVFTVSSVGNIGGLISTPVINHPQVGILGVGKVVKRPVYDVAGNIHPAHIVYLSFSFDLRVVDGAVGAAFGNAMIRRLQMPAEMLLPADKVSDPASAVGSQ
jgi:pyruvate dehydrogenase E2 component (dihydrolipoamide acetyltransferase)/2-oxoisovalerate dehydrogenase E2 component (dihydrolipoyl transacylase)